MSGLTALQVKHARPGRHADGRGLYLMVREGGTRSWVLRTQVGGKRHDIGLGSVSSLSLLQARAKASELRSRMQSGEDVRRLRAPAKLGIPTFAEAARACHAAIKDGWANKHHSDSWLSSLEGHIFPTIGSTQVDQVTGLIVRDALAPIWLTIPETARRCLQRVRTVLDFAHIEGWCPHEAALRSVTKGLPRQPAEEGHFAAMPYAEVPNLFRQLETLPETAGRDALMFTILTAARSGETRLAAWPEIDLDAAIWSIPPARMKMKKPHVVPLSPPALKILEQRWALRTDDEGLVFSNDGSRPLSDMTMTKVLRDLGHKVTVHGFRSSFTDWAAEKTRAPKEVVDKALAHKLVDRVEAAYRRTDLFDRRRRLMNSWAQFVEAHQLGISNVRG
jgi:integrase